MSPPTASALPLAQPPSPRRRSGDAADAGSSTLPVLASSALLQGQAAVLIEHLGQHYRLQATRPGKLILTK